MTKYVALPWEGEWGVSNESQANEFRDHYLIFHGSEAEAHIIAWALNAVADGYLLTYQDKGRTRVYGGPIDGVAP